MWVARLGCTSGSENLESPECPFANLPEARAGRWGEGLTAAKMKDCRWLMRTAGPSRKMAQITTAKLYVQLDLLPV